MKDGEKTGERRYKEVRKVNRGRDCTRLCASIKYFNHRLSCSEHAFDPDSKGLLQNKHFFEFALVQWDSPREKVQEKKKKEKEEVSYLHYVVESCFSSSAVLFNHSDKRYYGLVML